MHRRGLPSRSAASLLTLFALASCAPSEFDTVETAPITMVCDGGKSFVVSYANGFEAAIIEAEGQRVELQKVRSALSLNPDPPGFGARAVGPPFTEAARAGTTGVRYASDDAIFLSRNQEAVLELDGETFSNCEVER